MTHGIYVYQITGKVIRVAPHQAVIAIMVVGDSPCKEDFMGAIRLVVVCMCGEKKMRIGIDHWIRTQDVRAVEKDKVKIYNSFRPGDIVRAEVISLGDARSYYLSTAKNELGVIFATSVAGKEAHCTEKGMIVILMEGMIRCNDDPNFLARDAMSYYQSH